MNCLIASLGKPDMLQIDCRQWTNIVPPNGDSEFSWVDALRARPDIGCWLLIPSDEYEENCKYLHRAGAMICNNNNWQSNFSKCFRSLSVKSESLCPTHLQLRTRERVLKTACCKMLSGISFGGKREHFGSSTCVEVSFID